MSAIVGVIVIVCLSRSQSRRLSKRPGKKVGENLPYDNLMYFIVDTCKKIYSRDEKSVVHFPPARAKNDEYFISKIMRDKTDKGRENRPYVCTESDDSSHEKLW